MHYAFADFVLDADRRELRCDDDLVAVEPKVFDLLLYLIRNQDRVVSRDDLIEHVWAGRIVSESAIATCINGARAVIGDNGSTQRLIKTVPRKGIRFVADVESLATVETSSDPSLSDETRLALPEKPSVAVMEFANVGDEPEQRYFAQGMADEIITALSRCSSLFVIARNSSFNISRQGVDASAAGRELGVRYILDGSVRRAGQRLRFTCRLIDANSGAHVWAETYDGSIKDVFEFQDRITESVVGTIAPRLQQAEIDRIKSKPVDDLNAYDLMLQAHYFEHRYTKESLAKAIECLDRALVINPNFAQAMALAAYCYAERRFQGWAVELYDEAENGLALASRAVEVEAQDPELLWMCAHAFRVLGLDPIRARELFRMSLQLNPNSAMALTNAAWLEAVLGEPAQALQLLERAERISPCDPQAWSTAGAAALANYLLDDFAQAAACARRALSRNPRYTRTLRVLAASLAKLGRSKEAREVMDEVVALEPGLTISKMQERMNPVTEDVWRKLSDGWRLAGLPEK